MTAQRYVVPSLQHIRRSEAINANPLRRVNPTSWKTIAEGMLSHGNNPICINVGFCEWFCGVVIVRVTAPIMTDGSDGIGWSRVKFAGWLTAATAAVSGA